MREEGPNRGCEIFGFGNLRITFVSSSSGDPVSASAVQQRVYRMQDPGLTLDSVVELVKIYSLPGMGAYTEESCIQTRVLCSRGLAFTTFLILYGF